MVRRVSNTRKYEQTSTGLKAMTALLVLREKVIKPLLAASIETQPARGAHIQATRSGVNQPRDGSKPVS
jgi:hypothetical protein